VSVFCTGLGRRLVQRLREARARVIILDDEPGDLEDLMDTFPDVQTHCVDKHNWEETGRIVNELGPLDHLVNNAGALKPKSILETKLEDAKK